MKINYNLLKEHLRNGDALQEYTFDEIEAILGEPLPDYYIKYRRFTNSTYPFQKVTKEAGYIIYKVDYENRVLKFAINDGSIVIPEPAPRERNNSSHYHYVPLRVSEQTLDPNDIGKELESAITYFKSHWRTGDENSQYIPFLDTYRTLDEVYYYAGVKSYSASVNNRIPLFEGLSQRNKNQLKEQSFQYLKERFYVLFSLPTMNFDIFTNWEYETATNIRQIYRDGGVRLYRYGNAQKLINVALKFVLSSNLVDYHNDIFKYCFFPIDGIIQDTIKGNLGVRYMLENGERVNHKPSWAKCDNWSDLLEYQTRVREAIIGYGYYSPLLWEATHWE